MTTATTPHAIRHYLQFSDLTADEYVYLFDRMAIIKKKFKTYEKHQPLVDRTLAMIFEKASTRTRVWCGDAAAQRRFTAYWLLIRPASGLIRRRMLQRVRDAALLAP